MSVTNQQVTKDKSGKRPMVAPRVTTRARGFAGNHTIIRKENVSEAALQLQRKCECGGNGGGCEKCNKLGSGMLRRTTQSTLEVSEPGDRYEQEANRIADHVLAAPAAKVVSGAARHIQRVAGPTANSHNTKIASVDRVVSSPGRALEPALRQDMEQRFGQDFSAVRVHYGPTAEQSAREVSAQAYTLGHNIVFGAGRFAPTTYKGRRLLAHELTHVVQQGRGGDSHTKFVASASSEPVTSGVGAPPHLMRQPDEEEYESGVLDEDEEFEEKIDRSSRAKSKAKTQRRRRERATAGKQDPEDTRLSRRHAEEELQRLEKSYREPGAQSRSLKRKKADLDRFEKLLKQTGDSQLKQNQRKGAFDELERTSGSSVGDPQTKHVAGGAQLSDQELRAGKDPYAQPDYSFDRHRKDGTIERVHVNLKSDKIDMQTPAKARATARRYLAQAIKNAKHLADDEHIIISFARTPSAEVQEVMKEVFFSSEKTPVSELRFGTTTHKREDYKPAAAKPPKKGPAKTTTKGKADAAKKAKADAAKTAKADAAKKAKADAAKQAKADAAKKAKADAAKKAKADAAKQAKTEPTRTTKTDAAKKAKTDAAKKAKADAAKQAKTEPAKTAKTDAAKKAKADAAKQAKTEPTKTAKTEPSKTATTEPSKTATTEPVSVPKVDPTKAPKVSEESVKGGPPAPTTETVTTAHTGAPIEAIHTSTKGAAKGGAVEFGAQALLAWQLENVRGAELAKAEEALKNLEPDIEKFRLAGNDVTVTVIAEVPNQPDVLGYATGVGDTGQVVLFKKMFISAVIQRMKAPVEHNYQNYWPNFAPRDPEEIDPHAMTLDQQIRAQMGEKYPVKGTEPTKGFHYESRDLSLPAYTESEKPGARGIAGVYKPAFVNSQRSGTADNVRIYGMNRAIQVSAGFGGAMIGMVLMVDANDPNPYLIEPSFSGIPAKDSFGGRFIKRDGNKAIYRIESQFQYLALEDYDVLVEDVKGEDLDPNWQKGSKWSAQIIWTKQ